MYLDKKAIVEFVKERIIQLRAEGKMDFEQTTTATVRMDLYRELYPAKVHSSVKNEEEQKPGTLDRLIGEGIALGLTTRIKALEPKDVNLTESEINEIGWDVKMALGKKGLTIDDPDYARESEALSNQLKAERLKEKRAKLPKPKKAPAKTEIPVEEKIKAQALSDVEQELINALTYVEDLKKLLQDPMAIAEAYLEMDRDLLIVWQRLEREGKNDSVLAANLRGNYRTLIAKGLDKDQAMKETYSSLLNSEELVISRVRKQVFAQLFPKPIEQRFKRSFRNCRKPSQGGQNPLSMGESLKTALERALTMAPSLMVKKAVLDKMSRESRAIMPTGKLKRHKTP
ncbi:MAG: hypothetical protein NTX00_00135 [Candidatus Parcubacteria bacterium]|nr:hypothetical protein [Candidatus Parcubacteria bacterium]